MGMEVEEVINRASILLRAGVAWLYYRAGGNATRFRTAYFGDPPALELLSIEDPEASTDDEDSKTCLHIGICFSTEMQNERALD